VGSLELSEPESFVLDKLINSLVDHHVVLSTLHFNHVRPAGPHGALSSNIAVGHFSIVKHVFFYELLFALNECQRINSFVVFEVTYLVVLIFFVQERPEHSIESFLVDGLLSLLLKFAASVTAGGLLSDLFLFVQHSDDVGHFLLVVREHH